MRTRIVVAVPLAAAFLLAADGANFATWEGYLGGADSSQFTSLKQITKANVKQLQQVWSAPAPNNGTFNPVIVDGTMFLLRPPAERGGLSEIVALNAATGAEIWKHPIQGAIPARGINYWESKDRKDRRLVFPLGGFITALNARTGETIQSFGDNGRTEMKIGLDRDLDTVRNVQSSNPGHIAGDLFIASLGISAGVDNYSGTPADIHAYSVITGKLVWQFHSIPRPGEEGYDTWPADAYKWAGGVHNWNEMSVDEKRGIVYIPFGTGRYDFYGANRPGNNLYGNSLVALDLKTGKKLWHFQFVHHDLWDYDTPTAPKLLTVKHDGKEVDVVAQPTKQGFLFVFDRVTGKPLWPIEERKVPQTDVPGEWTSPTQPFPTAPPPFARQSFTEKDINPFITDAEKEKVRETLRTYRNEGLFTPPSLRGTIEIPGNNGGANWGSSAVNPTTGMIFIVSKELPMTLKLVPPRPPGEATGKGKGKAAPAPQGPPPPGSPGDFIRYSSPYDFMIQPSNGLSAIGPPWSQLTAIDLNTGKIKWQIPNGTVPGVPEGTPLTGSQFPRGGPVATANGMLIVATSSDKTLRFYDQDTGKVIHEMKLPAASEGVPAVYEVDGREYLALTIAGGNGMTAPKMNNGKAEATSASAQYVVFALPKK